MNTRLHMTAILLVDAALTGATGILMLAGVWLLDDLLDLTTNLLWISGLILVSYAGFLFGIRKRGAISSLLVGTIVLINAGWGIGCLAALVASWIDPNGLGTAFVLLQVVVVFVFAVLQIASIPIESKPGTRPLVTC